MDSDNLQTLKPSIGNPAKNALASIGITKLSELAKLTEQQLLNLHGVGPKAVKILKEAMKEMGISFKKK